MRGCDCVCVRMCGRGCNRLCTRALLALSACNSAHGRGEWWPFRETVPFGDQELRQLYRPRARCTQHAVRTMSVVRIALWCACQACGVYPLVEWRLCTPPHPLPCRFSSDYGRQDPVARGAGRSNRKRQDDIGRPGYCNGDSRCDNCDICQRNIECQCQL